MYAMHKAQGITYPARTRVPLPAPARPRVRVAFAKESPAATLQNFLQGREWAETAVQLHKDVHELVDQQLGGLAPQPTKYSPSGTLSVDSTMAIEVATSSGGPVWHKYTSTATVPAMGFLHTRTGVFACAEQTTPFLWVEIGGNNQSMLVSASLPPRLCLLRHLGYMHKYYRSVPEGSEGLISFDTLYKRMLARSQGTPSLLTASEDATGGVGASAVVYSVYTSKQLWSRLHGHAAMFCFDPCSPEAWEAVNQDVSDMVRLWCAWVQADWAQRDTPAALVRPDVVGEWRERSYIALNDMEYDSENEAARRLLGADAHKVEETVSGKASLAARPSWL